MSTKPIPVSNQPKILTSGPRTILGFLCWMNERVLGSYAIIFALSKTERGLLSLVHPTYNLDNQIYDCCRFVSNHLDSTNPRPTKPIPASNQPKILTSGPRTISGRWCWMNERVGSFLITTSLPERWPCSHGPGNRAWPPRKRGPKPPNREAFPWAPTTTLHHGFS
jgi:hypothetical protein